MIAIDTETTGMDFRHGTRPYLVTVCDDAGNQQWWEWPVCPLTRAVNPPPEDIRQIREVVQVAANWGTGFDPEISERHVLVGQNIKFDVAALNTLDPWFGSNWPWGMTRCTLMAGHLLASNRPHNLTDMVLQYLGADIEPLEQECHRLCEEARRLVRSKAFRADHGDWALAKEGREDMPSAKGGLWKADMWVMRAVADALNYPADHPYRAATANYANADSASTIALWREMKAELGRRNLTRIYAARLKVLPVAYGMEARGVTLSKARLDESVTEYRVESDRAGRVCTNIAASYDAPCPGCKGAGITTFRGDGRETYEGECPDCRGAGHGPYPLELPVNGVNGSLRTFMEDVLRLPPVYNPKAKTDAPTFNKGAMAHYLDTLPRNSKALAFVRTVLGKRARDTALSYMEAYERFWVPLGAASHTLETSATCGCGGRTDRCPVCDWGLGVCRLCGRAEAELDEPCVSRLWYRLHPNLNITGTDTLRWSSNNPNAQNISKQGEFNIRYCFGPAPGREWWSMDAKNIELRLPAYLSGEAELLALFETPDAPPYYGSTHLLNFHTVYPDLWDAAVREVGPDKAGPHCKKKYASTWYQWVKNGGFAIQYGAVDRAGGGGTADRAFHRTGAHAMLKARFSRLETLNRSTIKFAEKHGYVETIPDRTVDPDRGYPLLCTRTEYGKILETVPLSYKIQGSAMDWTTKAMVRVQPQLDDWNRREAGADYAMVLQVHDELVYDMPKRADPRTDPKRSNLGRARELQRLMEQGGFNFIPSIPTPVGIEYHAVHWAEGITF